MWEGVGVCSYLLVCFWFTRIAANQSSISALLTNRVGDCILTIGMFAVLWSLGNNNIYLYAVWFIITLYLLTYNLKLSNSKLYHNNKFSLVEGKRFAISIRNELDTNEFSVSQDLLGILLSLPNTDCFWISIYYPIKEHLITYLDNEVLPYFYYNANYPSNPIGDKYISNIEGYLLLTYFNSNKIHIHIGPGFIFYDIETYRTISNFHLLLKISENESKFVQYTLDYPLIVTVEKLG